MSDIMSRCDAFISPFFRCAGSKVTHQAMKCGLPVLYTSTGGLPEIVGDNGIMVNDYNDIDFLDKVPDIDVNLFIEGANKLKDNHNSLISNTSDDYNYTIGDYFKVMKLMIDI